MSLLDLPGYVEDVFNLVKVLLDSVVIFFNFLKQVLTIILSDENKVLFLDFIQNILDILFIIMKFSVTFLNKVVENIGDIFSNIDVFIDFIDEGFNFSKSLIKGFTDFIALIPDLSFNLLEGGIKLLDIGNEIFYYTPALLILGLAVYLINRLENIGL